MTQAIDITEQLIPRPEPMPVSDGIRYEATYGDAPALVRIVVELRNRYRMVTVSQVGSIPYRHCSFVHPPLDVLEPTFAAWLELVLAECQRRYDERHVVAEIES